MAAKKQLSPFDGVGTDRSPEFTVRIGSEPHQVLKFRRVFDFTELQREKQISLELAKEAYKAFEPEHVDIDDLRLQTIAQCFQMQRLSALPAGVVTAQILYRMSKEEGIMFAGIVSLFSQKMAVGEAVGFSEELEKAKN